MCCLKFRALLLVAVCTFSVVASSQAQEVELPSKAVKILEKYCYQCHGVSFKQPGLDVLDRATLLRPMDTSEDPYLVPNSLEKSRIWQVISEHDPQQMPPEDNPQPSDEEKTLLKQWIDAGADFPLALRAARPFRGDDEILAIIAADLQQVPAEHRRFTRYFTLLHLWNDPSLSDEDLRLVRAAVSKLINSLSRQVRITPARAIGDDGLVLAIDLRDYGWDRGRRWDLLIASSGDRPGYPYGLSRGSEEERGHRTLMEGIPKANRFAER